MRVGFIIGDLSNPGGGERVVVNLANYIVSKNENAIIFHYGKSSKYFIDERVEIVSIANSERKWLFRKIQRLNGLLEIKKKNDLDILFTFGWGPSIYGALICGDKIPFIASERIDPLSEPKIKLFRILRNYAYKRAKVLVCQTDDAARYFHTFNTRIILNPVKDNLPQRYSGKRRKAIVNFCRFTKQKNLTLLIKAFWAFGNNHNDYELELYGYGPMKEELIELAGRLGIEKRIKIFPFSEDVHKKIVDASMFVSSSIYEGLSNSMLEAMTIGLPVICTDCPIGGARMVIKDHVNGIIVPSNDYEKMAKAMEEIADNEWLAVQLSERASAVRESLSIDTISKEWYELIDEFRRPANENNSF